MNKTDFILNYEKIINGSTISNENFICVLNILKNQRIIPYDYTYNSEDTSVSQKDVILKGIEQAVLVFYKIYLGQ
ncbi:hypothetical protein CLLI_22710 [Clostridium liquoris]|jgi:regulatory protein YycI of two-component signal transduction system YycFG|uniref:Uncharacterized protein n=1 Tax=Clostridium liquoris TaxID=1289519 RepID=A0A2T0B1M5_9CLOT|nr:hypothetical protein [Clostridium liquoris]PRR77707.1 hypothetical protein CLLI_22710 [Clostridium liquoris]